MEITQRLRGHAVARSGTPAAYRSVLLARFAPHAAICLAVVALGAIALGLGHLTSFYSVDGNIKYLGALNISHHFGNPSITYPFHGLDRAGTYTLPLTAWYNGHDYAGYSLPFLYIAGIALRLFGTGGLILPSIAGTAVLLYVQLQLASLLGLRASRAVVIAATVAATPILFYSVSFWEHTWGVALLLAGIALLLRSAAAQRFSMFLALAAGGLFAGGVLMRRDTIIPALICLCVLPLLDRRRQTLVACGVAGMALCGPIAAILFLHPQPLAVGLTHASPGRGGIGVRYGLTRLDKLKFLLTGGWATALVGVLAAATVLSRRFKPTLAIPVVSIGSLVVGITLVFTMLSQYTFSNENVLAFCPLALWGLLLPALGSRSTFGVSRFAFRVPRSAFHLRPSTFHTSRSAPSGEPRSETPSNDVLAIGLWIVAVVGCLAVVTTAYDSGGAQWGPRYLLFSFPLLVLLALKARERLLDLDSAAGSKRVVNYGFVAVLSLSILLQGLSLLALHVKQDLAATGAARVEALHSGLVVSAFPVIDLLAPTYESNHYLYAPTQPDLNRLMRTLRLEGPKRLVLLCDPTDPCQWNGYAGWSHGRIHNVKHSVRFAVYQTG